MEWRDEGILLDRRPFGETSVVCSVFTRHHGRHLGLVRGGLSRRLRPVLQVGNFVEVTWRARLDEHLGMYTVELKEPVASRYFDEPMTLSALATLCSHLNLFAERDPHEGLYKGAQLFISHLDDLDIWPGLMVRFELEILRELGVGLDLGACAATGVTDNLVYVSPKSGRAVSEIAGEPYKDKLLRLPAFLRSEDAKAMPADLLDGFALTGRFFEKHFWSSNEAASGGGVPQARTRFMRAFHRFASRP